MADDLECLDNAPRVGGGGARGTASYGESET